MTQLSNARSVPRAGFRRYNLVLFAWAYLFLCACAAHEPTQAEATLDVLPPASGRLSDGFTVPHSFVERSDGMVLASDVAHREVWLTDFDVGGRQLFGRRGNGPGEYRDVHQLLPVGGDSVAIIASTIPYRVSVVAPDGQPVRTRLLSRFASVQQAAYDFEEYPQLSRADTLGRMYGARLPFSSSIGGLTYLDSVPIMRLDWRKSKIDTVAFFELGEQAASRRPRGADQSYSLGKGIFAAVNDWTVLSDGTVVAVDARSYSLVFVSEDGSVKNVPVLQKPPAYPIDQREWDRYFDSLARVTVARVQRATGEVSARVGKRLGSPSPEKSIRKPAKPDFWPPVLTSVARIKLANGLLWVPVAGSYTPKRQYWHVIGLDGDVKRHYALDEGVFLLEATSCWVYTARRDKDDLFWVSRHQNVVSADTGQQADNVREKCAAESEG